MMKLFRGARGGRVLSALPAALILLPLAAAVPSWSLAAEPEAAVPGRPADVSAAGRLKDVTVSRTPHYTTIEAQIDGKYEAPSSYTTNEPFRIVVNVEGVAGDAAGDIPVDTPQVKAVKVIRQGGKLRLVVETPENRPMPFAVTTADGKVSLSVGGGKEDKVTSVRAAEETMSEADAPSIVGIDLEDLPEASNVVITTSRKIAYRTDRRQDDVELVFPGATIPKGLLRLVDARTLDIPVREVLPASRKKAVDVVVRFVPGSAYTIDERENAVVVSFPKKGGERQGTTVARLSGKPAPAVQESADPVPPQPIVASEAGAQADARGRKWSFLAGEPVSKKDFRGQRISLDFKEADLPNVFRIIAEVSNLNIITTDEVKGKVTVRLVNVPWDQALDIVLQSKQLGATLQGNVLRIAPLSSLRAEEKARLDAQKEVEKVKASLESEIETIPVNYGKASEISGKVSGLLSEGGKIQVDDRTNMLIVRDLRKNIEEIKGLLSKLDAPIPQVLIEARIVEVDTTFTKDLGVQWGGSWNTQGSTKIGVSGIQTPGGSVVSGQPLANRTPYTAGTVPPIFAVNLPAAIGQGAGGGISFGILRDNLRLDFSLTALEAAGKARIVSSPKVVTIDNREALIEQGTQIPYSTVSASGTNTQFIDATLSLKVTPHITPEGSVIMKLDAKNDSQGEVGANGQPAINKKKATTEVLIRDGETAVIGGILQVTRSESNGSVPWFSKIPVVGALFRHESSNARNRELLIFITPRIMKTEPAQPVQAKLP